MGAAQLGDFTLEGVIGRGGMAEVFRGQGVSGPHAGRTVAIKRMHPKLTDSSAHVDLFMSEADIGKRLDHHAIVYVWDTVAEGTEHYIIMELVDGPNLAAILQRCRERNIQLPIDFCCYLAHVLADALDYAHNFPGEDGTPVGVVHCDVTPANVFVSTRGEVKLGDFGAVTIGDMGARIDGNIIVGKVNYMSPEQIRGESVAPATDVFGVGTVLYEMLTLHKAFTGDTPEQLFGQILSGNVTPVTEHRPDLPEQVTTIVKTSLAVDIEGDEKAGSMGMLQDLLGEPALMRYPTAAALRDALDGSFDAAVGTRLAMASVVRGLFPPAKS